MTERKTDDNAAYRAALEAAMQEARRKRLEEEAEKAERRMMARLYDFALSFDFCTRQEQAYAYKAMTEAWEWGKGVR